MPAATIEVIDHEGLPLARLAGSWTLARLSPPIAGIARIDARLRDLSKRGAAWNLHGVTRLDSVGALLLWRAWGRRWPAALDVPPAHRHVLERAAGIVAGDGLRGPPAPPSGLVFAGSVVLTAAKNLLGIVALVGRMVLDLAHLFAHPADIPWREFSANLYKSGARALPVTALIGFLIGVVLSYLTSLQLKVFGADIYIVNLLGISIVRELGPVLVAVLVAGRSGSAMTAQIGVMRVTEEIDALATIGVSRTLRLVLPKVAALAVAMPLLVVWCSAAGIVGGMISAHLQMDLSYGFFMDTLPRVVPVANVWIGLGKGFVFGILVALIACHFGLKVQPNTESLSSMTTTSVVTAITVVIMVDAVAAILTRNLGMPV
ncbi:MAG: ABC transporter permease [Betaproteobacteria bacterium]|nr:ABC transporter permease [Betaproteobacteria bacterium]